MEFACPKFELHDIIYRNVSFQFTSPKIPHNFMGLHHTSHVAIATAADLGCLWCDWTHVAWKKPRHGW